MPLTQRAFYAETIPVEVKLPVGTLNLTVRQMDGETFVRFVHAAERAQNEGFARELVDTLVSIMERTIASWDYLDDKSGEPLPVTRETILTIPGPYLLRIASDIIEATTRKGE